ncbi:MAG TPA: hypothetical protein DEG17_20765 [Cyanobacteria bacterium UBA11149]|nr:hypothetical protein [Cyanobacteria bacterium UBA11367]HBE57703.1 hypothetical protein [Cyanobacteria bacterium UBA11366]HBK62061.1 hypothetical protein [Cyanobacteria bacterium UBA11166]HBR76623.1 hypothetical protein [Cyanobacteria bacterium UBA11159]HBS68505.1 hypothetical protein [Cyanobacteria bacterium UBA11153]HBW91226.1 hypothetical protein [Cyanobacteria bacterium UBA11149]HCA95992.1 hypothetical protein [Cyanobacteria bacterium UBA9226]
MTLEELETQYKEAVDLMGNQLQNALLELSRTEARITEMGDTLANLTRIVEEFIQQQQQVD